MLTAYCDGAGQPITSEVMVAARGRSYHRGMTTTTLSAFARNSSLRTQALAAATTANAQRVLPRLAALLP